MKRLLSVLLTLVLVSTLVFAQTGATGTITAADGAITLSNMAEWSSVWVQITGTWTGTLQFEGTVDGTTYFSLNGVVPTTAVVATSTTANGNWQVNVGGLRNFRVRASAVASGTATVTFRASGGVGTTTPALTASSSVSGIVRTTPSMSAYTTDFLGGITTLASGSTSTITSTTTLVQSMYCNNATGSAVNVQITDGSNVYYVGPNYSLPANSNVRFISDALGYVFASGIRASAGTASAVNCQASGKQ